WRTRALFALLNEIGARRNDRAPFPRTPSPLFPLRASLFLQFRRQVERKRAPLARRALDANLAAEQAGHLSADRKAEASAAELPARRSVGLLERLEDQLLLVARNADARVAHLERDDAAFGAIQAATHESSIRLR